MDLLIVVFAALSITAIAIAVVSLYRIERIYRYLDIVLDEFVNLPHSRRRRKRIKRYILVKMLCPEEVDIATYVKNLPKILNSILGPILRSECSIALLSYRIDKNRAILRVTGYSDCVKHTLLALSIQHLLDGQCILVPIKTSGLLSRIRRFVGYR